MGSTQYAETLDALVERTGRTAADLRADSQAALTEMSAYVDESASRIWDRMGRWLTRSYEVDVDSSGLKELAELGRQHSLVFLPNHRSYLDPLVLRAATDGHGLPSNYTLGGINLAMWPLSELGKRSGLIFIRRSTRDDPVYPAMLRLYLGFLLRQHANLEWYFEGGRTRTGKLRPPRMGVLRYLVDAFRANGEDSDDAYLVPVSIVYDQQHEVSALSREESGGSKAPESLTWLYRFARAQGRRRGRVHVRFGPPLSLREALADAGSRAETDDLTEVVPRVAFEVAHRINAATPITPAALGDLRAARQRRSRDDPGRDARRPRTAGRLRTPPPAAADRRRRPRAPRGPAQGAGDPRARGRRGGVRRRARARLRDRARSAARGGVLSQHRHPLLHRPGDPRGGAGPGRPGGSGLRCRRRVGHLDARPGPARPAQVRVLLRDQG